MEINAINERLIVEFSSFPDVQFEPFQNMDKVPFSLSIVDIFPNLFLTPRDL